MNARKAKPGFRQRQLSAIHVLKARLRLDDDTYRAILQRVTGERSAADLDNQGRSAVLNELRRLQGEGQRRQRTAVPPPGAPENVREGLQAMTSKLGAMLADMGLAWAYLDGMAKRMFRVERALWCTPEQMHRLIAALAYHQKRMKAKA